MAEPQRDDFARDHGYTIDTGDVRHEWPEGHPLRPENTPTVVGHTDEARELVAAGVITPGSKALDVPVTSMSDRELAEEAVILLRNQRDAITAMMEGLNASPLGALISGGKIGGPLGMLFGSGSSGNI